MNTIRTPIRALGLVIVTLLGSVIALAVESPVRILPLGDSITYGVAEPGAEGGYRNRLYSLLNTAGYNVDFVGTLADSYNPGLPDKDHEGWLGYRIDEIDLYLYGWLSKEEDPDVILLHIGTNDFLQGKSTSATITKLNNLITNLALSRPFAKIIVAKIIRSTSTDYNIEPQILAYNAAIPDLVAQHVALGQQVSWVDMHSVVLSGDITDGTHPTTAGYNKMADAWFDKINDVILPKGTSNPPMIAHVGEHDDSTHLTVTFSKPLADSSANPSNFSMSGGVTVSSAVLEPTAKRTITLTTSNQTSGATYTLTVSGVRDRTTAQTLIAPQSKSIIRKNFLSNGSFEDTTLYSDWSTHTGNLAIKDKVSNPPYTATDGTKAVAFNTNDSSTPNGILSTSFATIPGQTYYLAFDLGTVEKNNTYTNTWTQTLNVKVQGSGTLLNYNATHSQSYNGINKWFFWDFDFVANSNSTTLTFTDVTSQSKNANVDLLLDNVRVSVLPTTTLAVTSTPISGTAITISPNDFDGNGSGSTGLIRSYNWGQNVTMTAPQSSGGRSFLRWQVNGMDLASTSRTINYTLWSNNTFNAVYDPSGGPVAPVAVADSYSTDKNTPLVVTSPGVLANDSDGNSYPITAVLNSGPSHGNLSLNANGGFTYTPNSNYVGPDSFSYHANNGVLDSSIVTATISVISVNHPPVAVPQSVSVDEDNALAITLTGTDFENSNLTFANDPPSHGVLSGTAPNLTYTPDANRFGSDSFTFTVNDGENTSDPATILITVNSVNDPPQAVDDGSVGSPSKTVSEDSGLSSSMSVLTNDIDVEHDPLTITEASSPNGQVAIINYDPNPQRLKFTPDADFSGPTTISYRITDGSLLSNWATVYVYVTPVNDAPVANPQTLVTDEDTALGITLTGSDVENSTLTFAKGAPSHGTLTGTAPNLTYTPAANYSGPDSFTFTVNDGSLTSAPATISITVTPVNDAPVANPQTLVTDEDTALGITLTGTDVENSTLTFAKGAPSHGTLTGTAPNLTYTPAANYSGPDSFTFTVNDGSLTSAPATISITVTPVNDAPVAIDDSGSADEDNPATVSVLANDSDVDSPISLESFTQGTNGAVTQVGNALVYTPATNFNGPDSFTYTITDGALTDTATVNITINPVNDVPVAIDDSGSADEDNPATVSVLANDSDVDSPISIESFTQGTNGVVTQVGNALVYTPTTNFNGPDSFTYTITDGALTDTATVNITIHPINDAPVATDDSGSADEDNPATVSVLANDSDVDSPISIESFTQGTNGAVTQVGNDLVYTPATNFNGPDSFTYTITDGALTDTATVDITIHPINDAPVASDDSGSADEDNPATVSVLANDSDVDSSISIESFTQGTNGAVTQVGNDLVYTPATNFNGPDSFTYTITDGALTDTATVDITIHPVNDPPVATPDSYVTDEDTELIVVADGILGNDSDIESTPLSAQLIANVAHGSLSLSSDGGFSYMPAANFHGEDSFTYKASDGLADSNIVTVNITVNSVGGAPITEWLAGIGIIDGPTMDSDNDSLSNAVEYVVGGLPNDPADPNLRPTATLVVADPDKDSFSSEYLLFSYRRTDRANNDPLVTIGVEWTTDISGQWTAADQTHDEVIIEEDNQAGPETDWVHVYIPIAPEGRLFARLKVVVEDE